MATTYVDRAVRALHAYLDPAVLGDGSGFEAFLRAYETQAGLAANTLPNPQHYAREFVPNDARTPLVQVYEGAFGPVDNRNRLTWADLTIAIAYTGDANIEGTGDIMRGYVSALIDAIEADPSLGGRVNAAWWTDGDRTHPMIDQDSAIRHVRAIGVTVHVHDPD